MNDSAIRCVVDASVAIKLFVEQPQSDVATELFAQLGSDPPATLYVLELFYAECANVLWQYVRRASYPVTEAQRSVARLKTLALQSFPILNLVSEALDLAVLHGISAYDACYVELAQQLNVPFVTADEKLIRSLATTSYQVYSLVAFPIPKREACSE